ncbi:hypothetical protein [Actinomyces bovis]|nr:hypothetical protein [Actinomyces bovis]
MTWKSLARSDKSSALKGTSPPEAEAEAVGETLAEATAEAEVLGWAV